MRTTSATAAGIGAVLALGLCGCAAVSSPGGEVAPSAGAFRAIPDGGGDAERRARSSRGAFDMRDRRVFIR